MLIECSNITKSFQGIPLLKDITFKIDDHDKVAIIGVNGAGKTTILKIISGEEEYDNGNLFCNKELSLGYLKQQHDLKMDKTVYEIGLDVFAPLMVIENRLHELEALMSYDHSEKILNEYDRLSHEFQECDGYSYPSKLTGVLKGLGFSKEELNYKVSMLSGGQKTRLALAKMLLQEPKLLLLDEPTNHLDSMAINFLEGYLKNYPHAVIIVSHDRYFIDQVSNKIVEIENGKSKTYKCKYDEYSLLKKKQRAVDLKHYLNQQKEIKRIQESIDTLKSYNREKQVKRAESKEKQLAKIERIERPENLPDTITINFKPKRESGFDVLKIEDLAVKFDEILFKNINIDIKKGETVALIGTNGSGKSTLLKLMTKILYPNKGTIETNGKLTSLLELGAGFHPDFTGRENIYFNASIFGLTRQEIDKRIDQIIEFSELGTFIDNPVRTYSSGMYMRLAFSVAINVDAEILLIDEILSVGDQHFQDKCFNKLKELSQSEKTIVIVSHSLGQIEQLCSRAIWVFQGEIKEDGNAKDVINKYLKVCQ